MKHLNGDLLCAIDCETTGLKPGFHEIIQIAIVPLDYDLNPHPRILPYCLKLKPLYPENASHDAMRINGLDLDKLARDGIPGSTAHELLDQWFKNLQLPPRKRIAPLAHNWPFDKAFIMEWLGEANYEYYFDYHYRDTVAVALYLNDRANFCCEKPPFPKVNLQYLCSQLAVVNEMKHDAMQDAVTCAKCYKKMLGKFPTAFGEPK